MPQKEADDAADTRRVRWLFAIILGIPTLMVVCYLYGELTAPRREERNESLNHTAITTDPVILQP